jgi:hypothetical protein
MDPYRLGPPTDRGEWTIINPNRPVGHPDRIAGTLVLELIDTHITGISRGDLIELCPRVVWSKDDTSLYDYGDPD